MSLRVAATRRTVLRFIGSAPLIPVLGLAASGRARAATAQPVSAEFLPMAAPATPEAQATTTVESSLVVTYDDGTTESFKLGYQPLFFTGDTLPDGKGGTVIAGGYYDIAGKPILDPAAEPPAQIFSDCPDGYTLLPAPEGAVAEDANANRLFAVVQFEYASRDASGESLYGQLPSPIAVLTLDQDKSSGALRLVKYQAVDTSPAHGLWITCGASLSPWGTHLSSEEYEPDAATIAENDRFKAFSQHLFGDPAKANPYHYGHLPEIAVDADGGGTVRKHYCLGRISHELVQVMPDRRTVLMGDDTTNGGLFMFVSDRPVDLSAGTLYAAKVAQRAGAAVDRGGEFDLQWIPLGHATSAEIEAFADKLTAADIVEAKKEDPQPSSRRTAGRRRSARRSLSARWRA
jgi:hypothetical protein